MDSLGGCWYCFDGFNLGKRGNNVYVD